MTEERKAGSPEMKPIPEFERLTVILVHQMRNSLSTILSAVSQIRKHSKTKSDEEEVLLKAAEEEVIRLNETVGGVLDFARPRAAKIVDCHPVELVRHAAERFSRIRGLPDGVTLSVEAKNEDLSTALDPELFTRAVEHLLANALESFDSEKGSIEVKIKPMSKNGTGVAVEVIDNGCGIPDDVLDRIFEPFFSTKSSSLGLGLTLVQRAAKAHQGEIEIESLLEKGTIARLQIPDGNGA